MIRRPVMRYPGGKFAIAKWVIAHFPPHQLYVELFGGAGSVLLSKPRSRSEVYNDLNDDIVTVFRVLRDKDQALELARLLSLTPYSRREYDLVYEPTNDPVELARRVIYRSFAGYGSDSVTRSCAGFFSTPKNNSGATNAQAWAAYPQEIVRFCERLQGVVIENRNAEEVIAMFDTPGTLFYADPPYVMSTRSSSSVLYEHEMTEDDHTKLAAALQGIRGMAIISGYPSELYDRLYSGWRCVRKSHHVQSGRGSTECLWLSPNIKSTLFDLEYTCQHTRS